jgi:NAD(P)-dependent dehydrogenase (short-subunit alcohol dehydrogenase family)
MVSVHRTIATSHDPQPRQRYEATRTGKWSVVDIPDQSGRVVVVTGANSGIGYVTAAILAYRGAHVVLAVRNFEKGAEALSRMVAANPRADVKLQELDLASLDSVRRAADALRGAYPRLDLLINNAGVMWAPKQVTKDGFEMQFGTNHLGHFALTGLILDHLLLVSNSRVVTVSSLGHVGLRIPPFGPHWQSSIRFDDLHWERHYDRVIAYGQSKLANLMFTYELQRRLSAQPDVKTVSVAAHPGGANTELARYLPAVLRPVKAVLGLVVFQSSLMGALPTLRAATDMGVQGGQYYGPDGFLEQRGHPKLVRSSPQSKDQELQRRLWSVSEKLTGVSFAV